MTAWCAEIGDVALRGHLEALEQTVFGSRKPAEPWDRRRFASALSIGRQAWFVDGGRTIAHAPALPALNHEARRRPSPERTRPHTPTGKDDS